MDPRPDLAAAYDAHVLDRESSGEPTWRDPAKEDLVDRLPAGAHLLELGAGVGYTSRWFADRDLHVVATDLSPANVEMCRAKGLDALVADMMDLPFGAGSFDAVWAASCLMHIPDADLPGVLRSIAGLLTDGGLVWAGTWGSDTPWEGVWEKDWYTPKRFYSIRGDEQLADFFDVDFELVSFKRLKPEPEIDWHYQTALLSPRR